MSRQINLYDAAFRKQHDWLTSQNLMLGSLLAVLAISIGAGAVRWNVARTEQQAASVKLQLDAARNAFGEMTRAIAGRKADAGLAEEIEAMQRNLDTAHNALGLLRGMNQNGDQRPVVGEMMRAFSRVAVDGVWLTGFVVAEGGKQLEIRGRMSDQSLLPAYLRRLESEPAFQGRRFASLDMRGAPWTPPADAGIAPKPAGTSADKKIADRWFVEFALRTTDVPKAADAAPGAR